MTVGVMKRSDGLEKAVAFNLNSSIAKAFIQSVEAISKVIQKNGKDAIRKEL